MLGIPFHVHELQYGRVIVCLYYTLTISLVKCQGMLYSISKFPLRIGTKWKHIVSFRNAIISVKELKIADSRTRKITEDRSVILQQPMTSLRTWTE